MSEIEVVIPHYSRWDLLERLLQSLDEQTVRPAVCVVDNGSTDESVSRLRDRGKVRVCELSSNIGFGRAVNLGIGTSDAEFVIVLNNDMVAEPTFVEAMLENLRSGECAVAATQLRPDGRVDTIGVAVDGALNAYDVGHGLLPDELWRESLNAVGPSGGAAGFRRSMFIEIGGYDDAIFAYLEDVDLAVRLRAAEIPMCVSGAAIVYHLHSATLGSGSSTKNNLMGWSRGYLLWKYRSSLSARARLRGIFVDGVVYAGQLVIDRNAGAIRGRLRFWRERHSWSGVPPRRLPVSGVSVWTALRRRLDRR